MVLLRRLPQALLSLAVVLAILYGLAVLAARTGIMERETAETVALVLGLLFTVGTVGVTISETLKEAKYGHLQLEGPPLALGSYCGTLVEGRWNPNRTIEWSMALFGRDSVLLCRTESSQPGEDIWHSMGKQISLFPRTALRSVRVEEVRVDDETRSTRGMTDALFNLTVGNVLGHKERSVFLQALIYVDVRSDGVNPDRVHVFGIPHPGAEQGFFSGLAGDLGGELLGELPGAAGTAVDVGGVALEFREARGEKGSGGLEAARRIAAGLVARATGRVPAHAA